MAYIRCDKCCRWLTLEERGKPCPQCGSSMTHSFNQALDVIDDKSEVACQIAQKHFQVEAGLEKIIRLKGSAEAEVSPVEPIKLLEVNANTVPSGVLPVNFGPAPASGIPYSTVIIEVSPAEFLKIQAHELRLPEGWFLGEEFPRPLEESVAK